MTSSSHHGPQSFHVFFCDASPKKWRILTLKWGRSFRPEQAKNFRDGSKRHKSSPVGKICVPVILGPIFIVDQGSMFFFVSVGFRGYLLTFGFYHVLLNILLVSAI